MKPGETVKVPCEICGGTGSRRIAGKCLYCSGEGSYHCEVVEYDGGPVWSHLTEGHEDLDRWIAGHYQEGTIHPKMSEGDIGFVHPCWLGPPPMPFSAESLLDQLVTHWSTEADDYEPTHDLEMTVQAFVDLVNDERILQPNMWHPVEDQIIVHQFVGAPPEIGEDA